MKLQLEAMALAMPEVAEHPNRLAFRGVLTLVGVPSQHSPSGAQGHRVTLSYKATEVALPSLLGMALDYAPAMEGHDTKRKIGIITDAEIHSIAKNTSAGQLSVGGFLYARDFPEVMQEIRAGKGVLGMSYEIANAWVPDVEAAVWTINKFTFTGAAVLRRDKAAYPETWLLIDDAVKTQAGSQLAASAC